MTSLEIHDSAQSPRDRRAAKLAGNRGLQVDDERSARPEVDMKAKAFEVLHS